MKSQTFLCSGMKWCIPWLILGGHFVGQTFWAITALRKKTWGKHHILVNQFLESFFNPSIPTIRMLRNILPFGLEAKWWNSHRDENIHFVADCFEWVEVVFVLESITPIAPKHTTFYENVFENNVHPINQVRIDAIAPQKRKSKEVSIYLQHIQPK